MKQIPLSQGLYALVDDEDYEQLSRYKWHALVKHLTAYAVRNGHQTDGSRRNVYMHAVIANTPEGFETDHIDGDGLNNLRSNLRVVLKQQNSHNRTHKARGKSSQYRGVSWHRRTQKWQSRIMLDRQSIFLGMFATELEAALAYDAAGFARDPEHFTPNIRK
jgi:hypothetical protein